ncbi:VOC family protein [Streptomyces sp. AP-93]|uniref:VOC family protein n=1 Tax=Streptomyces sp. AP-93 TaxID=2929048 RepID=UPI001FB02ABD|nr:VOC family protein [Streptomyces sp. AP-93]MCJ0871918.1 VOC family protein [Streptomyces sp. AP-93]
MQAAALRRRAAPAGIPTVRRVDHFAFTVPDLDGAIAFFAELLGGELCYVEGPVEDSEGDWMTRKLGVHPRASARVALLRVGPSTNLELFQYTTPDQRTRPPRPADIGWHRLVLRVADIGAAVARLRERPDVRVQADATTPTVRPGHSLRRVSFVTSWGMELQLCGDFDPLAPASAGAPGPAVVLGAERLALTVADLDAAVGFFASVLGATPLPPRRPPAPGAQPRVTLRLGPTDLIELRRAGPGGSPPPRNSDIGGHHIAFHTDDVDAAARYLGEQPGVRVMGTPETISDGPIAGNRWVYFTTPIGVQMEVLCMPDGRLPYERHTTARRAASHGYSWR